MTHAVTPAPLKQPRLRSVNELAAYLGLSRAGVYRIIATGELQPLRVGERLRFAPEDVDAYLERCRSRGAGP